MRYELESEMLQFLFWLLWLIHVMPLVSIITKHDDNTVNDAQAEYAEIC